MTIKVEKKKKGSKKGQFGGNDRKQKKTNRI